jgi:hypothetical protein
LVLSLNRKEPYKVYKLCFLFLLMVSILATGANIYVKSTSFLNGVV